MVIGGLHGGAADTDAICLPTGFNNCWFFHIILCATEHSAPSPVDPWRNHAVASETELICLLRQVYCICIFYGKCILVYACAHHYVYVHVHTQQPGVLRPSTTSTVSRNQFALPSDGMMR